MEWLGDLSVPGLHASVEERADISGKLLRSLALI